MPPRIKVPHPSCPYLRTTQRSLSSKSSSSPTTKATSYLTPKGQIPPESPKFIHVPQSRQQEQVNRPWVKGILPVPRELFPRSSGKDLKINNTTAPAPKPKPPNTPSTWREQQSALRRRNLHEGLVELHRRKQEIDRRIALKSAAKQAEYLRLASAPEPDHERLTNRSVHTAVHPSQHSLVSDPHREERIARKKANVAAKQASQESERRLMLHTLYMNARDFITTAAQLEAAINKAFDDRDQFTSEMLRGENVWNLRRPEKMVDLLEPVAETIDTDSISLAPDMYRPAAMVVAEDRLDVIAEELTGGKIGEGFRQKKSRA